VSELGAVPSTAGEPAAGAIRTRSIGCDGRPLTEPDVPHTAGFQGEEATKPFHHIERLSNHWARPVGPRSYYWFLTFHDQPELQAVVQRCQSSITFPYYDLTAPDALHMTIERVAFDSEISPHELDAVTEAAAQRCLTIAPLEMTVGHLGGTSGAIGFSAARPGVRQRPVRPPAARLDDHPAGRAGVPDR
jgi:hypothetical protein